MDYVRELVAAHPVLAISIATSLLLTVVAVVIWALREGREISFWPPKIGPRQSVPPAPVAIAGHPSTQPHAPTPGNKSEWYTEWRFGSVIHQEILELDQLPDGTVTGTRQTQSHKGVKEYGVAGYTKGGWYWLEYHDRDTLGGGTIQLHAFTSGRLRGIVTYPDCNSGKHLCFANQWLLKGSAAPYDEAWRTKLAEAY